MTDTAFKLPIFLIGNNFKYEIESVVKMFFPTDRFDFHTSDENACGDSFIAAGISDNTDSCLIYTDIRLDGSDTVHSERLLDFTSDSDKAAVERELCRLIYRILCQKTGIIPPWGLLTGIRPVKKVVDLIRQGLSESEI